MKKILLIAAVFFASYQANAQCTPGNYPSNGIYPDTLTNFVEGCKGVPYTQTITNVVPADTSVVYGGQSITATINYIKVDEIIGLPAGLSFECNVTDCKFPGGQTNCAVISGTTNDVGEHTLLFKLTANGTPSGFIPVPIEMNYDVKGYKIKIQDCGSTASVIELTEAATFSIFPNPVKDVVTISNLSDDMLIKNISIINAEGKVVHTYATNQSSLEINTSALKSGIYFVTVKQQNTKQTMKLVVE